MPYTSPLKHFSGAFSMLMSTVENQTHILGQNNNSRSVALYSRFSSFAVTKRLRAIHIFSAYRARYKSVLQRYFGLLFLHAISTERTTTHATNIVSARAPYIQYSYNQDKTSTYSSSFGALGRTVLRSSQ